MNIQENISLKKYNSFGLDAKARFFVEVSGPVQLQKVLELEAYTKKFILGGGSNMLLVKDIDALVIHMAMKGIQIVEENEKYVEVKAMAGENWHDLVLWCLDRDYGGLENLSLIPGQVGTAPIQNIGAYGVELKDVFVSCEAMEVKTGELLAFDAGDCRFGYRDSIFKQGAKDKYIISSVTLRLTKKDHALHTNYGAIETELRERGIVYPTIRDISDVVIAIRSQKLPDPKVLGNSGSFFKNPTISESEFQNIICNHPDIPHYPAAGGKQFEKLKKQNPKIPFYELDGERFKIPAAWLIEQCGFKGKRFGDAGVHEKQALVLVNYGQASGREILDLAQKIQGEVKRKFGLELHPEVNIIK